MSEKEFIAWLRGYVSGRISNSNNSADVDQLLDTLNEHLDSLDSKETQLLLDSNSSNTTTT